MNWECFDHAVAWLIGTGFYIGQQSYDECCTHVRVQTGCNLAAAQVAAAMAVKACGKAPRSFTPRHWPQFKPSDLRRGDVVYGGRIVYDEYVPVRGIVQRMDAWKFDGQRKYNVGVLVELDGHEFTEEIDIDGVYYVEHVGAAAAHFPCHYCGLSAIRFGFFNEPLCEGCGGE